MEIKYRELYKQKLMTPDEAVKNIDSGSTLVVPLGNGQPPALLEALGRKVLNGDLKDLTCMCALEFKPGPLFTSEVSESGTIIDSAYVGPLTRHWVQKGIFTHTPAHLSEASQVTIRHRNRVETVMYVVSPMDKHGYFSTGTHVDWAWEVAKESKDMKNLLVEVNENMPRSYGNNWFHISEVTAVVENHVPLLTLPNIPFTKEDELIANYIAEEIPNEACIQLGIGAIPNAVASFLGDKRDLSVHSEMLVDSMVELYEKGVITSSKKSFMPNKWIGAFAVGSKKLYDFLDNNPLIEMHSTSFVNNPDVCGRNDKLMSINATLEVDLTGQCASEAIAHTQYSGTGGQVDFVRSAWISKGGKSFLACYSTYQDKDGNLRSKINPTLSPGAMVTTLRADVQYIVTEYGIAFLKGQNLRTRAARLIKIAHPDFRDWLSFEAKRLGFVP